jgi:hypothetical protein
MAVEFERYDFNADDRWQRVELPAGVSEAALLKVSPTPDLR